MSARITNKVVAYSKIDHMRLKSTRTLEVSQQVAEVLIDHIINARLGRKSSKIKAFEAIIGAPQDGVLSVEDVKRAHSFYFPEQIWESFCEILSARLIKLTKRLWIPRLGYKSLVFSDKLMRTFLFSFEDCSTKTYRKQI